jgi:outer membrane receptor protein involved in Fe transport
MNFNPKLTYAIAAILSGGTGLSVAAPAADTESSDAIQEITVTAQRRVENMQDVPITIQALTGETLAQLNVQTIDDFIRYLPNVTSASSGPGQSSIYMRGLSTTLPGTQGSGGIGSFPTVAVYLDDQSAALPGRNLDIYAADLERIEVLEGPQGTLFGSGAESGVLRYITNKPKLDVTEGNVSAAYEITAHGDPSANVQAVLNLPLVPDTLAVRGVIYDDHRGGYINNVPGTFVRQCTDTGIHYAAYTACAPGGSGVLTATPQNSASNSALVGNAINPVDYQGIRLEGFYKINEDWNVLLAQSYQDMHAYGVFYETSYSSGSPGVPLPDLSVQNYVPTYDFDKFENTSLTVNGKIGDLKVVYTGGYLVRNIDNQGDYTNYTRGVYADYYQCTPAQPTSQGACYSPVSFWRDVEKNTHDSQELRVSTPDNWRLRGILGAFWEEYKINENIDWFYRNAPACTGTVTSNCFVDVGPPSPSSPVTYPYVQVNNPNVRPDNESYFDDIIRGFRQKALFGSADFEIIPKTLTLTAGTRYYWINTTEVGFSAGSFGCYVAPGSVAPAAPCLGNQPPNSPRYDYSNNETSDDLNQTYHGFRSRANLSWKVIDDVLLYYTWSQGFRPGGFNRGALERTPPDGANYVFKEPQSFTPDTLTNNEVGWKTQWFDHTLEFNGAVYQEVWKNVQEELFESCCFGNLSFVINGPNYRVRGLETQIIARPLHGLTVTGAAAWNSSSLTSSPPILDASGQPITDPRIGQPFGTVGSPLAQSPPFEATLRIRYDYPINEYNTFVQVGGQHQAHSISATSRTSVPNQPGYAYDEPGFSTYDASGGVAKDNWIVQLYGENITDVRADLYENPNQFVDAKTVNRPRTAGVRFTYKF